MELFPLEDFFALQQPQADPQAFLDAPVDAGQQEQLLTGVRNLWCTTIFQVVTTNPALLRQLTFHPMSLV